MGDSPEWTDGLRARVLVVAEPDLDGVLRTALEEWGYGPIPAAPLEEAAAAIAAGDVDLVLVDDSIGEHEAHDLFRRAQEAGAWAPPTIALVGRDHPSVRIAAFDAGATDVLGQPFDPAELRARVRAGLRLRAAREALAAEAATDPLTGLLNRARLVLLVGVAVAPARRTGAPLACAMVDLDAFKELNDTHGHLAGDDALRETARRLRTACRLSDVAFRVGGDELLVLLPGTDIDGARQFAEKLRRLISSAPVATRAGGEPALVRIRASIGVAELPADADTVSAMLEEADEALYRAKRAGRNRVAAVEGLPEALRPTGR
ncbi:MAG: diguanylate cyclase [Thermoleophilia bacterium]